MAATNEYGGVFVAIKEIKNMLNHTPCGMPLSEILRRSKRLSVLNKSEQDRAISELLSSGVILARGDVSDPEFIHSRHVTLPVVDRPLIVEREGALAYIDPPKTPRAKPKQEPHHHKKQETNAMSPASHSAQQVVLNTTIPAAMTPAALRKQAEELMKAAEAAEQRELSSALRETITPIQMQIAKATVAVQKHVDGLIDAASELAKASELLRKALIVKR